MQQLIVALGALDMTTQRWVNRQLRAAVFALPQKLVMLRRLAFVDFPAERREVVRALDVPFAKIRGSITARP